MTVERYRVGRASYNWRNRVSIGMGPEDAAALRDALSAPVAIAEDRLEPALQWAHATLEQAGKPLDPNAWCYAGRTWRRQNERRSAEWYAITILHKANWLRRMLEKGDTRMAADFSLDLGELITEAHFIFNVYVQQGEKGAAEAKLSDSRQARTAQHEQWCIKAKELWAGPPPWRNQLAVARKIDPDPRKRRNIIRVIQHLDPRKRK
jgi:hypothetical protein